MKFNKIFAILALLFASILTSCSATDKSSSTASDCSTVFESQQTTATPIPQGECKVLPIQITKEAKCEITGSHKIDAVLNLYSQNKNEQRIILIAPMKALDDATEMMSYKNQLIYYFVKLKIRKHIDSDLFNELKDFQYKGISCDISGNKLVAWLSEDHVIASFDERKKVKASR